MSDAAATAPRERGWPLLLAGLAAFLAVPAIPFVRAVVPLQETSLLLATALAACSIAGWRAGGRAWLAAVWTLLGVWAVMTPVTGVSMAYDHLTRGWALLLAASFGLACLLAPGGRFLPRALTAIAIGLLAATITLAAGRARTGRVEETVRTELSTRASSDFAQWETARREMERKGVLRPSADMDTVATRIGATSAHLPRVVAYVFPALLALESLVALALAWSLYHRVVRTRIGLPLARLRDFRFNDQLVWGLIVGLITIALPTLSGLRGPGLNLVVFFGALYALRGLGVLAWFVAPGRFAPMLLGIGMLLLPIFGAALALGVGLGDTWLDWRGRARPST